MEDKRESIDIYYLKMAYFVSQRSTCLRRKVGAILVRDGLLLASGYNGSVKKIPHCTKDTCYKIVNNLKSGEGEDGCRGAHAELNAIVQAASEGIMIKGATLYCTTQPCNYCAKAIANAGVERLVFSECYGTIGFSDSTKEILTNVKVDILQVFHQ